jgi:S1-C subfamily serine protease
MRQNLGISLIVAALLALAGAANAGSGFEKQVVALTVTFQTWDEDRPWAKNNPSRRVASAVVVDGPLLLTRAQIVADATLIQVERRGDARPWPARVAHLDHEIDLALLEVEDPAFFEGLDPVRLATSVPTEGSVQSVRWSDRQLEVGNSRVSKVEVSSNRYGNVEHHYLLVRTDLENGGWAEPVFRKRKLIGLTASQEHLSARVLPAEIIAAYLDRVRAPGDYRGFPYLDVVWQNNQDRALTGFLGLPGEPRGVLIRSTRRGGSACGALRARDILLELDGHAIDAIGNITHQRYGQILFTQIAIEGKLPGDRLPARVWRDRREVNVEIELRSYPSEARLIPWRRDDVAPAYFVAGGLVFRALDGPFLRTWGSNWGESAPSQLVTRYHLQAHAQTPDRRRLMILSSVLPDRYNLGYHDVASRVVESVNGQAVDSVEDLAAAFAAPDGEFHVVRLAPNTDFGELVLDATEFEAASQRILEAYELPAAMRASHALLPDLGEACFPEAS